MADLQFTYPSDEPLASNPEFDQWMGRLEDIMLDWRRKHGNLPYGLPLHKSTGLECWHTSFVDGMSPQEAFDSDQSYWEEE